MFVFHWLFYAFFYLVARTKGHGHYKAYRYNPFEIEAYTHEVDVYYLKNRRPFAWIYYIKGYYYSLIVSNDINRRAEKDKNR